MRVMEIIGKLEELGAVSEDREMEIKLTDVAVLFGAYMVGDMVKIYICDAEMSKEFDALIKRLKEKGVDPY